MGFQEVLVVLPSGALEVWRLQLQLWISTEK